MEEKKERQKIREKILELTKSRGETKTICPSEVVRSLYKDHWRPRMKLCQEVAWELEEEGCITVCQKGKPVKQPTQGPIRLQYKPNSNCDNKIDKLET